MVPDERQPMARIRQLAALLDDQIINAEKGRFKRVAKLMEASSVLASDMVEAGAFEQHAGLAWKDEIVPRYQRLELMLGAARETTKNELKQVQTTKNLLAVYRSSNR